ncbi:MAG: hypothetical protein MJZ24_11310 [Paludibacteraceae bacterium]|nr:hypothetical protein [Paludibacteraceae bacterium]
MKKILFSVFLLCGTMFASAQDTLLFRDGSSLLVKVLNIDADGIHYKKWINPEGPSFLKPMKVVKAIRYHQSTESKTMPKAKVLDFMQCSANGKTSNVNCITGNEIVSHIDSMYQKENTEQDVKGYIISLPPCIERKCISSYYLNRYHRSCESEYVPDILRDGYIYLMLDAEEELPDVLTTLAKLEAVGGNKNQTDVLLGKFEELSSENGGMFDAELQQLRQQVEELLHPYEWEDELKGRWVMLTRVSNNHSTDNLESPLILDIRTVDRPDGAHLVTPDTKVPFFREMINPDNMYTGQINTSQNSIFDGKAQCAHFQFTSVKLKDRSGNSEMVHDMLNTSQEFRVESRATIASSKADFEDKVVATILTEATASLTEYLIKSMMISSKTDNVYNLILFPRSTNVLNAYVSHLLVKTSTSTTGVPNVRYKENVQYKQTKMVRWEESDSVIFVSSNGMPITLSAKPIDDPILKEYYDIDRKYSLRNPAYSIPFISLNVTGLGTLIWGLDEKKKSFIRDSQGNKIPNGYGGYLFDEKLSTKAVLLMVTGGLTIYATNLAFLVVLSNSKSFAYQELNGRNLEKLRRKAQTTVSLSPTYYPEQSALGANLNISF